MTAAREVAFDKWWKLSIHNATLPDHRESLAREAYYAAWAGSDEHKQMLPAFRCDNCDNGVEVEWKFCAWCGGTADWTFTNGE